MTTPYASGSLYVGDLHPDVTEAILYDVFREVGNIISIRVCRDSITRKSLGYGYVNFQNPADAELALDTLNYTAVNGVPMRIMWSQRDPSVRKSGIGNVFIKNLDKSIDNKALYDTFSAFGNILSCKVETENVKGKNDKGEDETLVQSNGYGFVHFETQEAAEQAIAKVNNMLLNGKQVYVGPFIRRGERLKVISSDSQFTNVFVKNLDKSIDEEKLRELFVKFGEIQSAVIMKDEKNVSKGFAFVNFTDHEAADRAVEELNNSDVAGKKIYVGRAQKKVERQAQLRDKYEKLKQERMTKYQGVNVYVKNLDDTVDDDRLRKEFEKFGEITSAKIMRDEKDASKGFGFVCFTQPEDASKAIAEMSNKMVGSKPLYCALAQRKEQRRQQLEQQYQRRPMVPGPQMPMGFPGAPIGFYPPPGMVPNQRPPTGYPYPQMGGIKHQPRWMPNQPPQGGRGFPQPQMVQGTTPNPNQPMTYAQVGRNAPQGRGRGAPKQPNNVVVAQQPQQGGNRPNQRGNAYKFAPNARNRPQNETNVPQPHHQQSPQVDDELNSETLSDLPESKQKNILGERLYPLVERVQPDLAPKITGMLLDMEVSDIIHLIESPDALSSKIAEAVDVLEKHARTEQAQEE